MKTLKFGFGDLRAHIYICNFTKYIFFITQMWFQKWFTSDRYYDDCVETESLKRIWITSPSLQQPPSSWHHQVPRKFTLDYKANDQNNADHNSTPQWCVLTSFCLEKREFWKLKQLQNIFHLYFLIPRYMFA